MFQTYVDELISIPKYTIVTEQSEVVTKEQNFINEWKNNNHCINLSNYTVIKNWEMLSGFSLKTCNTIKHIIESINKTEKGISKISQEIIDFFGYTGTKTRHLYNNICNKSDTRYLEIGTWNGSSSMAAVYGNENLNCLFVDNWSQFGGDSENFKKNIEATLTKNSTYAFIENDCWKINIKDITEKFNVYLFDGEHSELDHFNALNYYYNVLDDEFIFLIDDWNWANVRDGTFRAIRKLNLKTKFRHEIFMSPDDLKNMPNHKGKNTYWNGVGIFLLSK